MAVSPTQLLALVVPSMILQCRSTVNFAVRENCLELELITICCTAGNLGGQATAALSYTSIESDSFTAKSTQPFFLQCYLLVKPFQVSSLLGVDVISLIQEGNCQVKSI